jgi:Mg/Co/Ni transporter MgtE
MSTIEENIDYETRLEQLAIAVEQSDAGAVIDILGQGDGEDTARLIDRLKAEQRAGLLELLTPKQAAEVLEHVHYFQGADILETLPPEVAAPVVAQLDSDDRADLLNELSKQLLADTVTKEDPIVMDVFDGQVVFRKPLEEELRKLVDQPSEN